MKKVKLITAGFVGVALMIISTITYGQKIDTEFRQNLEEVKEENGIQYLEDGKIKVKVNIDMIQQFYDSYDNDENISWRELIKSHDNESMAAFWTAYRNAGFEEGEMAEIKKELDKKYAEIAKRRNAENVTLKTMLTEKNKEEEKLISQVIKLD